MTLTLNVGGAGDGNGRWTLTDHHPCGPMRPDGTRGPKLWSFYEGSQKRHVDAHWSPKIHARGGGVWVAGSWVVMRRFIDEGYPTRSYNCARLFASRPGAVNPVGPFIGDDPLTGGFMVIEISNWSG